jgi:lipoyl(octanoyl) transferase
LRNRAAAQSRAMAEDIEWRVEPGPIDYGAALAEMEARAAAVTRGEARELVWLLEHPPVYTAGTSATDASELLDPRFPVHRTGRGGRYTYHGPGQRIGYVVLDLRERKRDVRGYVHALEGWVIAALGEVRDRGVPRARAGSASGRSTRPARKPRSARSACASANG